MKGSRIAWIGGLVLAWAWASAQTPPTAKPATLDDDPHLVGWWKFDEESGKTAADASGRGRHGVLEGGLSFETNSAPGQAGKALQFDGKEGRVAITGFKGITGSRPRTVAAWIKTSTSGGDVVSWGTREAGKWWSLTHVRGRIGVSPHGGYLYMKTPTHDDIWHHVVVVVREADPPNLHDHVKLYKDGEIAEIDDIGLLDLWPIETGDQQDVTIGRRFKGLIDDVRLYDRPLSEEEIQSLYKQAAQRP